jgi:Protein of unknown function (DUF998)
MDTKPATWRWGRADAPSVRALLVCGAIVGPLFVTTFLVLGALRPAYDPLRHSISTLALGAFGWIQSLNFIVAVEFPPGGGHRGYAAVVDGSGLMVACRCSHSIGAR